MENPRTMNRFFTGALAAFILAVFVWSILQVDLPLLLAYGVALGIVVLMCGICAFVNVIIFVPLFRLLAKLDAKIMVRKIRK